MGISLLIKELIESRKPIVGHNFIYDIGFLYHQFIDTLPGTYEQFKSKVHDCFPIIYDTKVLAHAYNSTYTSFTLDHVLSKSIELNKNSIKFVFPAEFRNLEEVKEGHDAGFDAFCTGKIFTIMATLIQAGLIKESVGPMFRATGISKEKKVNQVEDNKEGGEKVQKTKKGDEKEKLLGMMKNFKHGPNIQPDKNKK
jgi:DNA polymerase III epsilon subunit-like protein